MILTPRQKLTIFSISSGMANTTRQEVEVTSVLETPEPRLHYQNGPLDGHRLGAMKSRGKRTQFHLDIQLGDLVFEGWDLPLVTDFEVVREGGMRTFSGNACFNLGLDFSRVDSAIVRDDAVAPFVRAFILDRNLNLPLLDSTKGCCILIRPGDGCDDGELLWPEIETSHAVIDRMKEKLALA